MFPHVCTKGVAIRENKLFQAEKKQMKKTRLARAGESKENENRGESLALRDEKVFLEKKSQECRRQGIARLRIRLEIESPFAARYFAVPEGGKEGLEIPPFSKKGTYFLFYFSIFPSSFPAFCHPGCQNGGTCVAPFKCQCPAGVTGAFCEECELFRKTFFYLPIVSGTKVMNYCCPFFHWVEGHHVLAMTFLDSKKGNEIGSGRITGA